MDLLGNLGREWSILVSAPVTFVFAMVLAFGAAYFAAKLRYESLLKAKDQEIQGLAKSDE